MILTLLSQFTLFNQLTKTPTVTTNHTVHWVIVLNERKNRKKRKKETETERRMKSRVRKMMPPRVVDEAGVYQSDAQCQHTGEYSTDYQTEKLPLISSSGDFDIPLRKAKNNAGSVASAFPSKRFMLVLFALICVLGTGHYRGWFSDNTRYSGMKIAKWLRWNPFKLDRDTSNDKNSDGEGGEDSDFDRVIGESVTPNTDGWSPLGPVDNHLTLTLTFGVAQQNVDSFHEKLLSIATPDSSEFGQHMDYDDIHEWLQPSEKSLNTVKNWLSEHGSVKVSDISHVTPSGDIIQATLKVGVINALLKGTLYEWIHEETSEKAFRFIEHSYTVPKFVAEHLDFIEPSLRFPIVSAAKPTIISVVPDNMMEEDYRKLHGQFMVTPAYLRDLYHLNDETEAFKKAKEGMSKNPSNKDNWFQCVAAFLHESYIRTDLEMFMDIFKLGELLITRHPSDLEEFAGNEGSLDTEYMIAVSPKIPTLFWYTKDKSYFPGFLHEIMNAVKSKHTKIHTISFSYGLDEQGGGMKYIHRCEVEFAKASALGITFVTSSGDSGANDNRHGQLDKHGRYQGQYPATSNYVLAVGGAIGGSPKPSYQEFTGEQAWSHTGGGFSVYLPSKSYQKKAVNDYINKDDVKLPPNQRFNAKNNGFPDVSLQSRLYLGVKNHRHVKMGGTSAASPAVAGMISRINEERIIHGKRPLGWVNPAVYHLYNLGHAKEVFNDVINGQQIGHNADDMDEQGFQASVGWDPMTGLGTPKFPKLMEYLFLLGDRGNGLLKHLD